MNALKKLEKRIAKSPGEPATPVFARLIRSLCLKNDFCLADLYELDYDDFELALALLKDWRLDRFTKAKERLKQISDVLLGVRELS